MNENDKTEILEPVETPAENITEPSKDGRKCPKWLLPLVAAVCAVILVVAGIIGWNAYSGAKLAEAKEACGQGLEDRRILGQGAQGHGTRIRGLRGRRQGRA